MLFSKSRLFLTLLLFFTIGSLSIGQTYRIDTLDGQTINTCSGTFYDSGADIAFYDNDEDYTVTFCATSGRISFDFTTF